MKIALGADHGGLDLKNEIKAYLLENDYTVIDAGTCSRDSCDYPDFAQAVGQMVSTGEADRGILICGSGIGMSIAANKIPGIRAALCHEPLSARLTRRDNDSNVLTMGGRIIGPLMAVTVVAAWLTEPFAGGRHARRVDKIAVLEKTADGAAAGKL